MPPGVGLFVIVFPADRLLPAERTLFVHSIGRLRARHF